MAAHVGTVCAECGVPQAGPAKLCPFCEASQPLWTREQLIEQFLDDARRALFRSTRCSGEFAAADRAEARALFHAAHDLKAVVGGTTQARGWEQWSAAVLAEAAKEAA